MRYGLCKFRGVFRSGRPRRRRQNRKRRKLTRNLSPKASRKSADADTKLKKGQYATEAEAKARCKGTVIWIDKDKFNHYEGSREWGKKPGAFACEQG